MNDEKFVLIMMYGTLGAFIMIKLFWKTSTAFFLAGYGFLSMFILLSYFLAKIFRKIIYFQK